MAFLFLLYYGMWCIYTLPQYISDCTLWLMIFIWSLSDTNDVQYLYLYILFIFCGVWLTYLCLGNRVWNVCICLLYSIWSFVFVHYLHISCTCTKMYLRSMVDVSLSGDGKAREDVGWKGQGQAALRQCNWFCCSFFSNFCIFDFENTKSSRSTWSPPMQLILVLILSSIFVFVIAGWEDQVKQLYATAIDSSALLLPNCPLPMSQTKPSSGCEHFHFSRSIMI